MSHLTPTGGHSCPSCQAPVRPTARFCPGCGSALEPTPPVVGPQKAATVQRPVPSSPPAQPPVGVAPDRQLPGAPSVPASSPRRPTGWIVAGVAVVVLAVGGVVVAVLVGGRSDEVFSDVGDRPAAPAPVALVTTSSTSSSTSTSTTSTTSSTTTTTRLPAQSGTLYADLAVLRTAPTVDAGEITRFSDRRGMGLDILEGPDRGWYRVRVDGRDGWMFGSLLIPSPATPGYRPAETRSGRPAILRWSDGTLMSAANASGSLVLVVDDGGPLWEVMLPDGSSAWVESRDMRFVS